MPDGYREELCPDLRATSSGLAIRLVVPDDYRLETYKYRAGCRFDAALDRDFSVSMDSHESLRHYKEKWVDPDVGYEGDTGTGDIAYDADAAVYGGRRGELLTWGSNNDGLPLDNRLMQADGVRLGWYTPKGRSGRWAEELAVVTASIGVVETQRDTCTADGATATYTVPRPQTDDIDNYGDYCYLYLRPRESLLRYAQVDPVPRRSVEELAAALRRAAQRRLGDARARCGRPRREAGRPARLGRGAAAPDLGRAGGHLAPGHDRPRRPPRDVGRDAGRVAPGTRRLHRLRQVRPARSCPALARRGRQSWAARSPAAPTMAHSAQGSIAYTAPPMSGPAPVPSVYATPYNPW